MTDDQKKRDEISKDYADKSTEIDLGYGEQVAFNTGIDWMVAHLDLLPAHELLKHPAVQAAIEALQFYADHTNFEAVDEGRNFNVELVVEEYNDVTVSGDPVGTKATKALAPFQQPTRVQEIAEVIIKAIDGRQARNEDNT